jgi:hypothetical protein
VIVLKIFYRRVGATIWRTVDFGNSPDPRYYWMPENGVVAPLLHSLLKLETKGRDKKAHICHFCLLETCSFLSNNMNMNITNNTTTDGHGEDSTVPAIYNNQTLPTPTTINVNSWVEENVTGTNVPVTEVEVVPCEYANLQWDNCDFDESGSPVGVFGKLWMQLSVAKLRIICRKLLV